MGRALSLILGLVCLLGALYTAHRTLEFRQHGEVVPGEVLLEASAEKLLSGRLSYSQRLVVRYTPLAGGEPLDLQTGWTSNWFTSPDPGDPVDVRYLPEHPDEARLDNLFIDIVGPLGLLVLGLAALAGSLGPASHGSSRVLWRGRR